MKLIIQASVILLFIVSGCGNTVSSNEIIIFHAGSLSVPLRQLKDAYEKQHPGISILLEPSGSLVCARKVTELKKPCDIVASADYSVIEKLLIPGYTSWNIKFATNELVIAYNDKAKYGAEINSGNWIDILSRNDVIYGRSDPNTDPCGYRTVLLFRLAEKYYSMPGLTERLISKDQDYIRPKSVDLVALAEAHSIDYMFEYKSVAIQHGMKYIELPDEINLSDPSMEPEYKKVSVEVTGNKPGSKIRIAGDYIMYSITVLDNAPHRERALKFLQYMLSEEGMDIFRRDGQKPIVPAISDQPDKIPAILSGFIGNNPAN